MSETEWTWELASTAQDDLASLPSEEQDRILDKLDEIVEVSGIEWERPHPSKGMTAE